MSSVRRVFIYIIALVTLGIFAAGLRTLLFLLFDTALAGPPAAGSPNFVQLQLSLGLAMLIMGGPLWFFFWRSAQRHSQHNQVEIGAASRKVFLNLVQVVTALIALFAAQDVFKWLISGVPKIPNASGSLAMLIVTLAIWYYHWRISETEGHPTGLARTLRRWYVYITAGWGLVWLAIGLVELIYTGTLSLGIWGPPASVNFFWSGAVQVYVPYIILGGLWWAFHWFYLARSDIDSALRHVYIYLLAIVGSAIAGLTALVIGLDRVFVWALGVANGSGPYFQFLGAVIPILAVSAAIWSYHRSVVDEESAKLPEQRLSTKRVHLYIMSFLGLGTLVAGLVILVGILINLAANAIQSPVTIESGWWQKQLSLALALLIVAFPIWWYYWSQILRMITSGGFSEGRARSRRIYLYVIVGATILGLAADLVNIIYQIMSGALTGDFGVNVLRSSTWSMQSLVAATPLLVYHWRVMREDQQKGSEAKVVNKNVTLLAGSQSQDLIPRLENKLGFKIKWLQYTGEETGSPDLTEEELARLVEEIESSPLPKVMLVYNEGKMLVLPYQEK